VQQLRENDDYYDPYLFRTTRLTILSVSAGAAGMGQRQNSAVLDTVHGIRIQTRFASRPYPSGDSETVRRNSADRWRVPIVLLLNDQGYGDHLYKVMEPTLRRHRSPT